jgi:DUF1680 family protein
MLFQHAEKAQYIDALEQTRYNHILGAEAVDGSNFSYYGGLNGRAVHAESRGSTAAAAAGTCTSSPPCAINRRPAAHAGL